MRIFRDINKITRHVKEEKEKGSSIGFVPTMGYLHKGHLSLIRASKKQNDATIVSIFVNPAQFGENEDYKKYPRDFKRDERLAKKAGVDGIFYPSAKAMYPQGYKTYVNVDDMSDVLCGVSRPGHFRGVATIVTKLFNIIQPDVAYFGQKDAEQVAILKKMARDLNMSPKIKVLPIIRERDGLAMSSRNSYLSKTDRKDATILYKSLKKAQAMVKKGERDSGKIIKRMYDMVRSKKTTIVDYISIVDSSSLKDIKKVKKGALIALAVWIGKVRLIDNIIARWE